MLSTVPVGKSKPLMIKQTSPIKLEKINQIKNPTTVSAPNNKKSSPLLFVSYPDFSEDNSNTGIFYYLSILL
jgi:hypothetical protein